MHWPPNLWHGLLALENPLQAGLVRRHLADRSADANAIKSAKMAKVPDAVDRKDANTGIQYCRLQLKRGVIYSIFYDFITFYTIIYQQLYNFYDFNRFYIKLY